MGSLQRVCGGGERGEVGGGIGTVSSRAYTAHGHRHDPHGPDESDEREHPHCARTTLTMPRASLSPALLLSPWPQVSPSTLRGPLLLLDPSLSSTPSPVHAASPASLFSSVPVPADGGEGNGPHLVRSAVTGALTASRRAPRAVCRSLTGLRASVGPCRLVRHLRPAPLQRSLREPAVGRIGVLVIGSALLRCGLGLWRRCAAAGRFCGGCGVGSELQGWEERSDRRLDRGVDGDVGGQWVVGQGYAGAWWCGFQNGGSHRCWGLAPRGGAGAGSRGVDAGDLGRCGGHAPQRHR